MMCPVCKRDLAPTLSICFTCGAMVNDSVREELETKIGRVSGDLERTPAVAARIARTDKPVEHAPIRAEVKATPEPQAIRTPRGETTELGRKKTSPTLVGFQPKTSSVPDWRLQLQNSIRQRKTDVVPSAPAIAKAAPAQERRSARPAQKLEGAEDPVASHDNPRVAAALQRIENSRRRFLEDSAPVPVAESENRAAERSYPFNVVSRGSDLSRRPNAPQATVNTLPKPRLVTSVKAEKRRYITNRLPPLPEAVPPVSTTHVEEPEIIDKMTMPVSEPAPVIAEPKPEPKKLAMIDDLADEYGINGNEEDDDLAAIPSRFLAGLFDTIIGAFATGIVLSPFLLSGSEWMTVSGVMTLMGGFGVVMFIYMTIAIGLRGRTVGMRLFGLEVVDAEENEYPTMHQAAVSSAVYLLSIPMLGLGFLPLLFNEERRAAHDLISGTVLVREI